MQIWEQYKGGGDAENRIKEPKEDFGAEGFSMDDFYATEAAMRMVTMSYNLISLYRQLTYQGKAQPKLPTLRFNYFAVGSWVVKKRNETILKISVPQKRRLWFDGLMGKIKTAEYPLSLMQNLGLKFWSTTNKFVHSIDLLYLITIIISTEI